MASIKQVQYEGTLSNDYMDIKFKRNYTLMEGSIIFKSHHLSIGAIDFTICDYSINLNTIDFSPYLELECGWVSYSLILANLHEKYEELDDKSYKLLMHYLANAKATLDAYIASIEINKTSSDLDTIKRDEELKRRLASIEYLESLNSNSISVKEAIQFLKDMEVK